MRIYAGITDKDWYNQLSNANADEVNFWKPGATPFRALQENDMFLFKLHSPYNAIVGGGFFVEYSLLPTFLAWDAFGLKNGVTSMAEFKRRIAKYRKQNSIDDSAQVGCIILTDCFWFKEDEWIPVPEDWSRNIVSGKTYGEDNQYTAGLFDAVQERLTAQRIKAHGVGFSAPAARYGESMTKHRLGQGAFRVLVTEAYEKRCAITGEKTLPVLQAAHIKPYAENGPHSVNNGLLLKSDFHTLFDGGYLTVTPDLHIEVSGKLHEDFGNGKDYYKHHGERLLILPGDEAKRPAAEFLTWHNEHVYRG